MNNRVVITGLGVVSSLGMQIKEFWENIKNGKSGISHIEGFDTEGYASQISAEIKDFATGDYIDRKDAKRMALFTQYGVVAALKALADAKLEVDQDIANEVGVLVGSGIGGIEVFEKQVERLVKRGPRRISPFFIPMMISNMVAGQIAIYANAKGPNSNEVTACASGTHSIGEAAEIIKRGDAKVMIAGGAEASISPSALAGFSNMRALSTRNDEPEKASRPFDKNRDGFIIGEGSGILILEEYEFAKNRGANIIAELSGYGMSADAYHMTQPDPDGKGAYRAMEMAIKKSGIPLKEFEYINAHGTSTPLNDKLETKAIRNLFGDHADSLAVSSSKSMTGHLLGAAGGIEAIISVLAIRDNIIPPTMNYENEDPECDLDYVPNEAREVDNLKNVLSNSFGFGGQNACLVLNNID